MDERKQYVPTAMRTYPAGDNTVGLEPESVVREAANKKTNYKNVNGIPVDTNEAMNNAEINERKHTH
jgi:predicted ATP-grasp superfamily ATP-dependent carboligase